MTDYRKNGSAVGGGGGVPLPSTDGYLSVTSGAYDTPSSASDIVAAGISSMVGSDPAGTAIVSDGAGGIQPTSADVSTLLGAADAAAARAALYQRTVATSTLTATNGTGTATAATGVLSYASGQTGSAWADFPRLTGAHGGSVWAMDAAVRVTMAHGFSVNSVASLSIGTTGSTYGAIVLWRVGGTGSVDAYDTAASLVLAGTAPGTLPVDGTGWLRARVQGGVLTLWTGVGASYAAAAWTMRYRGLLAIPPLADSAYPLLAVALYQGVDPGATGVAVTFNDLTITDLS